VFKEVMAAEKKSVGAPDSVALLLFFAFWYAGNMKYNEVNSGQNHPVIVKVNFFLCVASTIKELWLLRVGRMPATP
jgi:hypothetical protein